MYVFKPCSDGYGILLSTPILLLNRKRWRQVEYKTCLSRLLSDADPKRIQSAAGKLQLFYQVDREKSLALILLYHTYLETSVETIHFTAQIFLLDREKNRCQSMTRNEIWKLVSITAKVHHFDDKYFLDFRHYISSPKTSYSKTSWSFSARDLHVKHQNYSDQTNLEWKTCFGLLTVLSSRKT